MRLTSIEPLHRWVMEALFDRKKGELTPLARSLVGLILAIMGLSIFVVYLIAFLGGEQSVRLSNRPYDSRTISIPVASLFGLFLGTSGVATLWRGLTLTYQRVTNRWWIIWSARLMIVPLVLLLLGLSVFVLADLIGLF